MQTGTQKKEENLFGVFASMSVETRQKQRHKHGNVLNVGILRDLRFFFFKSSEHVHLPSAET